MTGDDPIIGKPTTLSRRVLDIFAGRGARRGNNTERLDRMENYRIHQASHRAGPESRSRIWLLAFAANIAWN